MNADLICVHLKNRVAVALVADLVDFLFAPVAAIEAVRAVDHDAVHVTDVLIGVTPPRRYQHRRGIVRTDHERRHAIKSLRLFPVVPHAQLEIRWSKKTKEVSLIDVLVRSARDARIRRRDVRHHRIKFFCQIIMTKELSQPAARVENSRQTINNHSLNLTVSKAVGHWQLPLRVRNAFCSLRFQRPDSRPAINSQTYPHRSTSLPALPKSS